MKSLLWAFLRVAATSILLIGGASAAYATTQLEEVLVTAQKRAQNLQEVPMAVTAIDGETIRRNEINSMSDLAKLVPSLRLTGDGEALSLRIRGVGTDVFSKAVEANVSVVVDGVPLARNSLANFDFFDIARIEVLRGPQGTLFGKNASAGLVHIITQDPSPTLQGRVRASYENPENFPGHFVKSQFSISGPFTSGFGAGLSGFHKRRTGHLDDIEQGEHVRGTEQYGLRSKFKWDVSDVLSLRLAVERLDVDGQSGPPVYRSGNPGLQERSRPIQFGENNRQTRTPGNLQQDSRSSAESLTIDWQIGDFTFTSISAFRDAERADFTGAVRLLGDRVNLEQGAPLDIQTFTQEFRLLSPSSEHVEYTLGLFWLDNALDRDFNRYVYDVPVSYVAGLPNPPDLAVITGLGIDTVSTRDHLDSAIDTENLGIYGQATWHITDQWHLTAGTRYIDEKLSAQFFTYSRTYVGATDTLISEASSEFRSDEATVSDSEFIGTVSLQYDWSDHSIVYSTLSKGYRGAAFDVVVGADQGSVDNPVDPEISKSLEIGVKSRLFNDRLELNVAAFLTRFTDFQAQIVDLSGGFSAASYRLANAGELETRGVEIDFKSVIGSRLFVFGSLLFDRAVFNEFITQCFVGQQPGEAGGMDVDGDGSCDLQDVSGGVLPNAPKWSASLTMRYEHVLGDGRHRLYGQLAGRWQDEVQFTAEQSPATVLDAYGILDLRMGWNGFDDRLEVAAYINNLLRQNYATVLIPLSLENDRRDVLHGLPMEADRIFGVSIGWRL